METSTLYTPIGLIVKKDVVSFAPSSNGPFSDTNANESPFAKNLIAVERLPLSPVAPVIPFPVEPNTELEPVGPVGPDGPVPPVGPVTPMAFLKLTFV